jgi:hypothetical protein
MGVLISVIYDKIEDGIMCVCISVIIHLQLLFAQVMYESVQLY